MTSHPACQPACLPACLPPCLLAFPACLPAWQKNKWKYYTWRRNKWNHYTRRQNKRENKWTNDTWRKNKWKFVSGGRIKLKTQWKNTDSAEWKFRKSINGFESEIFGGFFGGFYCSCLRKESQLNAHIIFSLVFSLCFSPCFSPSGTRFFTWFFTFELRFFHLLFHCHALFFSFLFFTFGRPFFIHFSHSCILPASLLASRPASLLASLPSRFCLRGSLVFKFFWIGPSGHNVARSPYVHKVAQDGHDVNQVFLLVSSVMKKWRAMGGLIGIWWIRMGHEKEHECIEEETIKTQATLQRESTTTMCVVRRKHISIFQAPSKTKEKLRFRCGSKPPLWQTRKTITRPGCFSSTHTSTRKCAGQTIRFPKVHLFFWG